MKYEELYIGQKESVIKVFTQDEVNQYSIASGDTNPIHYDVQYASLTFFEKPIIQGLLVASLFGGILGSILPGPGTIHLGQTVKFLKPVFVGEKVVAEIELISKRPEKFIIVFACRVLKENGEIAILGEETIVYKGPYYK